ncbi:MAG: OmpH family outer membrane protein [Endomicrobia bacterium]|nr:OmpH family outer membrane protein [Endomicrobiia bacterium]
MKVKILFLFYLIIFASLTFSLEIQTYDVKIIRIGVVDMDKVLKEHPAVEKAQQDIALYRQNKTAELANIESEIEKLLKEKLTIITEIEQLKTQLENITKSTETVTNVEISSDTTEVEKQIQQLNSSIETKQRNAEQLNRTIEEKKQYLNQKRQELEDEILKMKQKAEVLLYAELYEIIQKIAQQEGLNIIINKSGILYGEPEVDITEKVIKKLK